MSSQFFPSPIKSTPDGLVCIGGELSCVRLLDAYRHGIFPWPADPDDPILWWSPDPRAILPLDAAHVSQRVKRRMRTDEFQIGCNDSFESVIRACATGLGREGGTWLTEEMIDGYCKLHRQGHAHSVEVWHEDQLVGGTYGVAIGGLFAAESMFHRRRDASKVALACLVQHLNAQGYQLLDVQQWTPHTGTLGVIEIPRAEYIRRLAEVVDMPITFGKELKSDL